MKKSSAANTSNGSDTIALAESSAGKIVTQLKLQAEPEALAG